MPKFGLDMLYAAKVTKDDKTAYQTDTPRWLQDAITINSSPQYEDAKVIGDNKVKKIIRKLTQMDVSFTLAELSQENYDYLFGTTTDEKGVSYDSITDEIPDVALGYRGKHAGIEKYIYTWLYKGNLTPGEEENQSEGDGISLSNVSVSGSFYPRNFDGKFRGRIDETSPNADATAVASWFDSVYGSTPATP
jgi:phi13 family phage major tail protein